GTHSARKTPRTCLSNSPPADRSRAAAFTTLTGNRTGRPQRSPCFMPGAPARLAHDSAFCHLAGIEKLVHLLLGEIALLQHNLADRTPGPQGLFRHLCALGIADDRVQRRDEDSILRQPALCTLL